MTPQPGPTNTLTDVRGLRVGHATRTEPGWMTGTTVVLMPVEGAVAGVEVRGGAPGTRETDLLDPRNLVDRVHGVVLTGGSALGLAAADGVCQYLYRPGRRLAHGRARRGGPDRARRCAVRPRAWRRVQQPPRVWQRDVRRARRLMPGRWHSGASAPAPAPRPAVSRGASAAPARSSRTAPRSASWSRSTRSGRPTTRPRASCWPCATASARSSPASGRPGEDDLSRARQAAATGLRRGTHAPGDGHHARRHRHGCDAQQGGVPEGRAGSATTASPGRSTRCTPSSTGTRSSRWPRASVPPPTWLGCTR